MWNLEKYEVDIPVLPILKYGSELRHLVHQGSISLAFFILKGGNMIYWAIIVMLLAAVGAAMNIFLGTPFERILHDIVLFLVSIGMLVRIRYKINQGEREKSIKEEEE